MGLAPSGAKLLIEAPVNGGRNYRSSTDCSYVNKPSHLLETPVDPLVLVPLHWGSDNP